MENFSFYTMSYNQNENEFYFERISIVDGVYSKSGVDISECPYIYIDFGDRIDIDFSPVLNFYDFDIFNVNQENINNGSFIHFNFLNLLYIGRGYYQFFDKVTVSETVVDLFSLLDMHALISLWNDLKSHEDIIEIGGSSSSLTSLNGNGCEYIDGDILTVVGRDYTMTVKRSFYGVVADNSYTVMYDLESANGAKVTAPENLVARYIAPVTTP